MTADSPASSWFGRLESQFLQAVYDAFSEEGREPADAEIKDRIAKMLPLVIEDFSRRAAARGKVQIRDSEKEDTGFSRRNQRRWRPAFDALELLWHVCAEIGGEFNQHYRAEAVEQGDFKFEALTSLHARSLLVAREALTLMRHGYAEGALARWRMLHELTCTALLIQQSSQEVAFRYLASFRFQAYWAARQVNQIIGEDAPDSFSAENLLEMKAECDRLSKELGSDLKEDCEWARPVLDGVSPKARVSFRDIERAANQTGIRPYYQWASQHSHSGYRPNDKGLGLVETTTPLLLIGPSDAGMPLPLQLVALNLSKISAALLMPKPSLDVAIYIGVIEYFSEAVAPIAFEVERKTREASQRKASHP